MGAAGLAAQWAGVAIDHAEALGSLLVVEAPRAVQQGGTALRLRHAPRVAHKGVAGEGVCLGFYALPEPIVCAFRI